MDNCANKDIPHKDNSGNSGMSNHVRYTSGNSYNKQYSALNQAKDICHIWELGGGTLYPTLLSAPLAAASHDLNHLTVVLMLDLAAPQQLWFTLETLIQNLHITLRKQASTLSGKNAGQFIEKLQEEAWKRVGKDNEVKDGFSSFHTAVLIALVHYILYCPVV
jgi:dynein light intermediate chain 2